MQPVSRFTAPVISSVPRIEIHEAAHDKESKATVHEATNVDIPRRW